MFKELCIILLLGVRSKIFEHLCDATLQSSFQKLTHENFDRCIPFKHRNPDEGSNENSEKVVEVLMINSPSGPGLLFPKVRSYENYLFNILSKEWCFCLFIWSTALQVIVICYFLCIHTSKNIYHLVSWNLKNGFQIHLKSYYIGYEIFICGKLV